MTMPITASKNAFTTRMVRLSSGVNHRCTVESADALIADLEQMLADANALETTLLMFLQMESK